MRTFSKLAILIILIVSCSAEKTREIEIPEGKVGLIGYGSLTSKERMTEHMGKPYEGVIEVVHLNGYQRAWNATTPNTLEFPPVNYRLQCIYQGDSIFPQNFSVLNIIENDSISINCCFFIVDEEDLALLDRSENGYGRIDVTNRIEEFKITRGTVWAYQALVEYSVEPKLDSPTVNATPKLYLEFLEDGFVELGEDYKREFYETTLPAPSAVMLDCTFK